MVKKKLNQHGVWLWFCRLAERLGPTEKKDLSSSDHSWGESTHQPSLVPRVRYSPGSSFSESGWEPMGRQSITYLTSVLDITSNDKGLGLRLQVRQREPGVDVCLLSWAELRNSSSAPQGAAMMSFPCLGGRFLHLGSWSVCLLLSMVLRPILSQLTSRGSCQLCSDLIA